jgi:hypothetical protein
MNSEYKPGKEALGRIYDLLQAVEQGGDTRGLLEQMPLREALWLRDALERGSVAEAV